MVSPLEAILNREAGLPRFGGSAVRSSVTR